MENFLSDTKKNEEEKKLEIAFAYKHFMQSFYPYKKTDKKVYERMHNFCTVSIISSSESVGLPYGIIPRILMVWLGTQSIKQKTNKIYLPATLTSFVKDLGFRNSGGVRGDLTRIKDQLFRLVHTAYSLKFSNSETYHVYNVFPIKRAVLWWDKANKSDDFDAYIELSEDFTSEIKANSVPVNFKYIKELTDSCLAFDIYVWLCYRFGYLKDKTFISWLALKQQFGSQYRDDKKGQYNFKIEFLSQLKKVLNLYVNAKIYEAQDRKGLVLLPSQLSIPRRLYKPYSQATSGDEDNYSVKEEVEIKLVARYGFSKKHAKKIVQGKSIDSIQESINALEIYIQNKSINNLQSLVKKAIDDEWKIPIKILDKRSPEVIQNKQFNESDIENEDWKIVRNDMKNFLGDATYRSWIYDLIFLRERKDIIILGHRNAFTKQTVEEKFLKYILSFWVKINPSITKVIIEKM